MDGPGWRAAAPTECRGPVASEQLQRPAFCIGLGLQPMASIRACLMRLDGCPYSAANSRQMPHLGDAAPYECNSGLYLAWHLGLALLRGIIVGEQRAVGNRAASRHMACSSARWAAAKHNTTSSALHAGAGNLMRGSAGQPQWR